MCIRDRFGGDVLEDLGEAGVERARSQLGDYGRTVLDYKEVTGAKGFDKVGKAFEYLGNNLALSLPYMGATIVGTAAAPFTGGASLALPVSLYTGQVWNEMEGDNKSAALAVGAGIAQATLDRLGLKGIISVNKAPQGILNDAVGALVRQGMSLSLIHISEPTRPY